MKALIEAIKDAAHAKRQLHLVGGGSKAAITCFAPTGGESLFTRDIAGLDGIVSYEPSELVITVAAATPLATVNAALAERGQMLGALPPLYSAASTIGGVVAAGINGGYWLHGGLRNAVLGVRVVDGRGQLLRFGGTVIKNVAGYDVARLFCGSRGSLGVITELSLRASPCPPQRRSLTFAAPHADAAQRRLQGWLKNGLAVAASSWVAGEMRLLLAGSGVAVDAAHRVIELDLGLTLPALAEPEAEDFWQALTDQRLPWFSQAQELWRWRLGPVANAAATPALPAGVEEWREVEGQTRWLKFDALPQKERVAAITQLLAQQPTGSSLQPWRSAAGLPPMPREAARQAIVARLKAAFDPHHVFV